MVNNGVSGMYTVCFWGLGKVFKEYLNEIEDNIKNKSITVLGIIDSSNDNYEGIKFNVIDKTDLSHIGNIIDYCVISSTKYYKEIYNQALSEGIDSEKIIPIRLFMENIDQDILDRYEQVKEISIISNNCWGGITYHYLGIENKSPFINLAIDDEDYIKIVNNLDYYLDLTPRDGGLGFNRVNNTSYPVGILDDVRIKFLHYKDFEEAKDKWECRKQRINKNYLFFMMYTEDKEMLHLFNGIGSNHKVCFVPFKSDYKNAMTLISDEPHEYFWELVNGAASGKYRFYNTLKLLTGE